ncbi:uncharacterized protein METZ01_LOCUS305953 [marine metagenome]|uniref:Prolyl 4-hydroxylase alpha subunit Fe(2+) 2OG dioxygenase domain-containing protein n=1 Tax=marine metagenome TaxID=408172 RepID=A0A382MW32_9ZZZZ
MHLFFSTPIWSTKIDNYKDVNEELYSYIKNLREQNPEGIKKSNFNGWHSKDFDLNDETPKKFIYAVSSNINTAFNDMDWDIEKQIIKIRSIWAIINEKGAFNERHHHGNSALSAAYYVRAPKDCGDIEFYDPRPAPVYSHPIAKKPNILNATVNSITPDEGMLVLFPSYLDHSVRQNLSSDKRIVISFNVNLIGK